MFTTLYFSDTNKKKGIKNIFGYIVGDKITCEIRRCGNITARSIRYVNRRNRVNYNKLCEIMGKSKENLVCSSSYTFPQDSGINRYVNNTLKEKYVLNTSLFILDEMMGRDRLKIGFYDFSGDYANFLSQLLKRSDEVTTYTENVEKYQQLANELLDTLGASAIISTSRTALKKCDFIIAPQPINIPIELKAKSVLFTSVKPTVSLSSLVYYDYAIDLDENLMFLKPQDMDTMDFACVLYAKERINSLGKLIPKRFISENSSLTQKSIVTYVENIACNA